MLSNREVTGTLPCPTASPLSGFTILCAVRGLTAFLHLPFSGFTYYFMCMSAACTYV